MEKLNNIRQGSIAGVGLGLAIFGIISLFTPPAALLFEVIPFCCAVIGGFIASTI